MDAKEFQIRIGVLTVSDRCYNGINRDVSGEMLETKINNDSLILNGKVVIRVCVPDEYGQIQDVLIKWTDVEQLDVVITTGGTGLSERDITPEVTKSLIHKDMFGISAAIINYSIKTTPFAMLCRPVSGVRNKSLIINFPGSSKACLECLDVVAAVIPHAVNILKNNQISIDQTHSQLCNLSIHQYGQNKSMVDISKVAKRKRHSPFGLVTVKGAQNIIKSSIVPQRHTILSLQNALGYVLHSDIYAKDSLPPFRASIKDGYAVLATDGSGRRRVINSSVAGSEPFAILDIKNGECIRVATGAPVPYPADAVVQVEDTVLISASGDGTCEFEIDVLKTPMFGDDIREVGSDIMKGTVVLKAGTFLTSAELGILATVGVSSVSVISKPVVSVLSTGNELVGPDEILKEGKIRDSNRTSLLALLRENGFKSVDGGIMPDEPNIMMNMLKKMLRESDVLVTSGSASMGEHDILTDVLQEDIGVTVHFGRVFMKPGKPTKFATVNFEDKLKYIFILPGNPVSALVTFHLFVLPALRSLSGDPHPYPNIVKARIANDIDLDERYEYQRANLKWVGDDSVPLATPAGSQASSCLLSMVSANCLLHLPASSEMRKKLLKGDIVDGQVIGRI